MNNSENKSYDTIPYMLINLGDVDTIYIGRDTLVAYIKGEDAGCEYVDFNEIIEDIWGINWQPPHAHKMVTSDLVNSPAQVTEHRCMELKDQSISEDTKRKFEKLKEQFPKVFSLSNEDIGCTQLVTMDVDMGDSPPICQKPYTYHIGLSESSKAKTAFITPFGKYQFEVVPFGLAAPQTL